MNFLFNSHNIQYMIKSILHCVIHLGPIKLRHNFNFIMRPGFIIPKRRHSTIDSNARQSPSPVKLRTFLKSRGSHKQLQQNAIDASTTDVIIDKHGPNPQRYSKSLDVNKMNELSESKLPPNGFSKNTIMKLEALPENNENDFNILMTKLNELDAEAEDLIRKKIMKISKKSKSITLKNKGKDQISEQIEKLIEKVKDFDIQKATNYCCSEGQIKILMDKKMRLLEKLLAQNSTELQVLKKYFFAISAQNQKNKSTVKRVSNNNGEDLATYPNPNFKYEQLVRRAELISSKSVNHIEFNSPKPSEYESYRYKHKNYVENAQPFPRSSYKREFLVNPNMINFSCKNSDSYSNFGTRWLSSSSYSKDFQRVRTEITDYRELDSYRNKIKNLPVSFNFKDRKQEAEQYIEKSRRYIDDQLKMRYNYKNIKTETNSERDSRPNMVNSLQMSESRSKFEGQQPIDRSDIKNKQLNGLKYNYKMFINF